MSLGLFGRLAFALKYRTTRKVVVCPDDAEAVLVCHSGAVTRLKRRCPHQGAPLEEGYFKGDALVCPWHGCRFNLKG